jgi:hypothetical protein
VKNEIKAKVIPEIQDIKAIIKLIMAAFVIFDLFEIFLQQDFED